MVTYLDVASKICHITRQPFNYELALRIVDSFKSMAANYIRRQASTYGVQSRFILSYIEELQPLVELYDNDTKEIPNYVKRAVVTKNLVFPSVNLPMATPFTAIKTLDGVTIPFKSNKYSAIGRHHGYYPKLSYSLYNGRIIIFSTYDNSEPSIGNIEIYSVFEDPAELLNRNSRTTDPLEVVIPIPIDYIEAITADLLKIEFGITPEDKSITEKPNTPQR